MNAGTVSGWVDAAGWALIHSLWQSLAVALLAKLAIAALRSRSGRVNSAVYSLALIVCLAVSAMTFLGAASESTRSALASQSAEAIGTVEGASASLSGEAFRGEVRGPERNTMGLVVAIWAVGASLMSLRLLAGAVWLRQLRRKAVPWADEDWQRKFSAWCADLGIKRAARLCTSAVHATPCVIGHFKPLVLIPGALLTKLAPEQLEAVILHELMHIRRNDYLLNILRLCAETVFFFNPGVWWLSRAVRAEREHACDELVAEYTGNRIGYAKALVRLEELRIGGEASFVLAAGGGSLKARVSRLLCPDQGFARDGWAAAVCLAALVLAAGWAGVPTTNAAEAKKAAAFAVRAVVDRGSANSEILALKLAGATNRVVMQELSVSKKVLIDSSHIASASVGHDPIANRPEIQIRFTPEGSALFAKATGEHVRKQLAIVIDGVVVSAPFVNEPITGGACNISGNFSEAEAKELAARLDPKLREPSGGGVPVERIQAPQWQPPAATLPSQVLQEARDAKAAGRYADALARHVWYHTASRNEAGQGGVRVSFALSDWVQLGQAYPPAMAKLKEVREETEAAIKRGSSDADLFTLFQEYAGINWALSEFDQTAALFRWLDTHNPDLAAKVYPVAQQALLKTKEYKLARKYLGPGDPESLIQKWQARLDRPAASDNAVVRQAEGRLLAREIATTIALFTVLKEEDSANRLAEWALRSEHAPELRSRVPAALRGEFPDR